MTENTSPTEENTTEAPAKGTWQETLAKSATLFDRSAQGRKSATALLWKGAVGAIEAWEPDTDVSAEGLYNDVKTALGESRKGDASKIKTVALAVKNNGLVLGVYPNLSKAYVAAVAMTKTVAVHQTEDDAAEAAVKALAEFTGATVSTPEDAAKIVLAKGVDEAARLLLDALGATNEAAHRSFMRAISQEISGRIVKPVKTVASGPKAGATQVGATASTKPKATIQSGATKGKAAPVVRAGQKAKPVIQTKAKPVPVEVPVVVEVAAEVPAEPVAEAPKKASPVVRRATPVKRSA